MRVHTSEHVRPLEVAIIASSAADKLVATIGRVAKLGDELVGMSCECVRQNKRCSMREGAHASACDALERARDLARRRAAVDSEAVAEADSEAHRV